VREECEEISKKLVAAQKENEELDVKLRETYSCSAGRESDVNLKRIQKMVLNEEIKSLEEEITASWEELVHHTHTILIHKCNVVQLKARI